MNGPKLGYLKTAMVALHTKATKLNSKKRALIGRSVSIQSPVSNLQNFNWSPTVTFTSVFRRPRQSSPGAWPASDIAPTAPLCRPWP